MIHSMLVLKDLIYSQEENEKLRAEFERFMAETKTEIAKLQVVLFSSLLGICGEISFFISLRFPRLLFAFIERVIPEMFTNLFSFCFSCTLSYCMLRNDDILQTEIH